MRWLTRILEYSTPRRSRAAVVAQIDEPEAGAGPTLSYFLYQRGRDPGLIVRQMRLALLKNRMEDTPA